MKDAVIEAIEKENREYLAMLESREYKRRHRLEVLKHLKPGDISFWIRRNIGFRTIRGHAPTENLPEYLQKELARFGRSDIKVVVYTCVAGPYDQPEPPLLPCENTEYILFSNDCTADGWKLRSIPEELTKQYSPGAQNRYLKFHPFELFEEEYDYAVYIDGNITPISDLSVLCEQVPPEFGIAFHAHSCRDCIYEEEKACAVLGKGDPEAIARQLKQYREEGFPEDYGMIEGNVIAVDLHSNTARKLLGDCWEELNECGGGRDQLVWPYILWKNGITPAQVSTLGKNVYRNPKLRVRKHVGDRFNY